MRGRPPNSVIRDRLAQLLSEVKRDYGYNIYRLYCRKYPKVSMRVVYYHLSKGVELGLFRMERVETEGEYSWGGVAEKVFYSLEAHSEKPDEASNPRQEHKH
jgi:hypothetical protein